MLCNDSRIMPVKVALRIAILIFMALLAGRWATVAADSPADQVPAVVILNSYHQGYEWSDSEIQGLLEGLHTVHSGLAPVIEHLDLKRFSGEDHENRLRGFLADKYRDQRIDLAVILDNPAFDLILSHRDEILPGVPIVFAGVNDFTPGMLKGQSNITGVAEGQDHAGTLALALGLHPGTRRVLAVHDYTASGLAVRREMEAVFPAFRDRVQVDFNAPATYEEMAAQIARLPPDSLALILSFATDSAGKALAPDQSTAVLTAQARVPVYAMHETRLGHGIVGGMLIGGAEHGRRAAALALRVLAGEDPASIPVETQSTAQPMFDYVQLQRFEIPLDALPAGSVLVNRPVSLYEQHKAIIWGAAGIIGLLLVLVGSLLFLLQRKNSAEHALRESEARYRIVADNTYDWEHWADPQGRFLYVSPSCKRISGYSAEEYMKRADLWRDIILPEDKPKWDVHSCAATHQQQAEEIEFRIQRVDGGVRWISHVCRPVFDPKGSFLGSRGSNRDVTERMQMVVALRESESRFRLLYEKAPLPYQSLDENGNFIEVNQAFLGALGYAREEVIGRNFGEVLAPEWGDHFKQNFPRFKAIGEILGVEFEMVKKDGSRILVSFNGRVAHDDQGRFKQTHCIFTDITERRRAEVVLQESEERLKEAQAIARIGRWELNFITNALHWSESIYDLFEIDHSEFGASYEAFLGVIHPSDRDRVNHAFTQSLADKTPYEISHRLLMPDGRVKWVVEACRTDYDEHGNPLRSIGIVQDITERKQAEMDLQAQRDMLETIFENSPFIMMLVDQNMRVKRINRVGADFAGKLKEEILDLLCGEVVRCINSSGGLGCGKNAVCGECLVRTQVVHTLKTGDTILDAQGKFAVVRGSQELMLDMLVSTARVKVADLDFVLVTMSDITERKQAAAALSESEANFRLLVETAPEAIFIQTRGFFTYLNSTALKLFQAGSAEELIGRPLTDRIHPDYHDVARERSRILNEEKQPVPAMEQIYLRMDGSPVPVEVSAVPFKYQGDNGALVFPRDITIRKKAEVALRESEERHRRIVEASSDAFLLRSGGMVIYANPAALKLFRANHPGDLIGKQYLGLVHPDDRALSAQRVQKNIDENWIASPREHRILALDGQVVNVESTGVPVKYRDETQIFGVFRDITERKRDEQEKEKLEAQLRQAQKMEAIGTLAGGIAHDFNNILSVVIGNAEILEFTTPRGDSSREGLGQILAASQRAKQLVRQILAFSRHGKQEKILIDPKPIVKETLEFLRASLPASIQLQHYLEPASGKIMGDPTQLQQVLMNLCTNAGHAMEKDGGCLQIKLSNTARGDLHVEARVVDAVAHHVERPHAGEHGIGVGEGDETGRGHAGGGRHHVLLGDPEVE